MNQKSQPSSIDRRRFLDFTWRTVGASLALALVPDKRAICRFQIFDQSIHAWGCFRRSHAGRDRSVDAPSA